MRRKLKALRPDEGSSCLGIPLPAEASLSVTVTLSGMSNLEQMKDNIRHL